MGNMDHQNSHVVEISLMSYEKNNGNEIIENGSDTLGDNEMPSLIDTTVGENISTNHISNGNHIPDILECNFDLSRKEDNADMSRNSDSRISLKKRKQKKNQKSADIEPPLSDESKRKSKSIEVFDFYVNTIDDIKTSDEMLNGENVKIKPAEKEVIESLLNTVPADFPLEKKTDSGSLENKALEEEVLERPTKSNQGSKCNTLRRGKNSRNSKKRRKRKKKLVTPKKKKKKKKKKS